MARCTYVFKNGKKCKSYALKGDSLCYFHSPRTEKERAIAAQKGGKVCKGDLRKDIQLESAMDIMRLLEAVINAVKTGKLDPKVSNSLFYGANISLKAIELFKVQSRIEEISRDIEQQRRWGQNLPADWDCLDLDEDTKKLNE